MANPHAGEATLRLDGVPWEARLTLGALAELEADLPCGTLVELIERFEAGTHSMRDIVALIVAGLRGAGWRGTAADLVSAEIGGGPAEAARVAARLLVRSFGT